MLVSSAGSLYHCSRWSLGYWKVLGPKLNGGGPRASNGGKSACYVIIVTTSSTKHPSETSYCESTFVVIFEVHAIVRYRNTNFARSVC